MKKFHAILCLLLALTMLLCASCTPKTPGNGDGTDTSDSTSDSTPKTVDHIWYSDENFTVVDLRDMPNIAFYNLQPGYYQYTQKYTGTCTYEDNIVTFSPEDGDTLSWVFDTKKGALTFSSDGQTATYSTKNELPAEYVKVPFPKFAEIDCKSLVTLPSYREFTYTVNVELLAAVDVFEEYYASVQDTSKKEITGRAAQMGDYVSIDYEGFHNNVAFDGGKAEDVSLVIDASSGYISGFAEGIVGQTVGSTFDVPVTFPEDYPKTDMAGKEVIFKMTLHAIYDLTISDEEAKKIDESKTYAELIDAYAKDYRMSILQAQLLEKTTFGELPESTYLFFYRNYQESYHMYAAYYGMEYDALLAYFGLTDAHLLDESKSIAKEYVLFYAIAQTENIIPSAEDFETWLDAYFEEMEVKTEAEKQEMLQNGGKDMLHVDFVMECVYDWLMEQIAES